MYVCECKDLVLFQLIKHMFPLCVSSDESEVHVDYEDRFTDSHEEAGHREEKPEETHDHMYEEVDGAAYWKGKMSQEQQETGFGVIAEEELRGKHGEQEVRGELLNFEGAIEGKEKDEERAVQDFIGHSTWEPERREVIRTDAAAATEAPVSLLSQKHMFWFPSEAFQEEGLPASTDPVAQSTQRASGAQSEESKEQVSQERHQHPVDGDDHDHDRDRYDDHDREDQDDHEDSHQDQDDHDSHQDEDDHDDDVKHYIPAQHDDLNRRDSHEKHDGDHDDHYDMGEREDDRVRYGSQEYDDQDDTDGKQESYEDHEDQTDRHGDDDDDPEHLHASEEIPDHDDHDDDLDQDDNDRYTDHDDHEHDDHDSYDDHDSHDHDSHEHDNDSHKRVIFSIATDQRQNITQKKAGGKAATDETWLDGYPVVPEETEKDDSATERVRPEHRQRGTASKSTDRPNEVEIRRPAPFTSSPEKPESPTTEPELEGVEEVWAGFVPTAAPSPDRLEPSDTPSYFDTLDYDTQQAAPTHSWLGDLTEHPFLDHGPAPPVHNGDTLTGVMEEHTMHTLPGETGERGEMEGERGETICTGEDCPPIPPGSSSHGPKVAAIIVVVFAVAAAVIVGVWCYRRQQQKSSVYEMNGKGQSQSRQGQHIEMQQKV